jgi:hypothetical protein
MKERELMNLLFLSGVIYFIIAVMLHLEIRSNAELTNSISSKDSTINRLKNDSSALEEKYRSHAQINLSYANKVCRRCERKLENDSDHVALCTKID